MDELKLTGNCLKGSRPILSFDKVCIYLIFSIELHLYWYTGKNTVCEMYWQETSEKYFQELVKIII